MKTQERNKYEYLSLTKKYLKSATSWNGIPAFIHQYDTENTLFNHFFLSVLGHIIGIILLSLLFTVFKITGMDSLMKPPEKVKDIEFNLTTPSHHRHRQKVLKEAPVDKETSNSKKTAEFVPETIPSVVPTKTQSKSKVKSNKKGFSANKRTVPDDFSIPMPKFKPLSSGSGGGMARRGSYSGSSSSSSSSGAGYGSGSSNGTGSSSGRGFDKTAARKAFVPYDISPYVNELKRDVRMNWRAPKNQEGKYVELFLRIAKDGRLVILNVKRTSEVGEVDNAALSAVRKAQPFNPLPSKYNKGYLDVIFTFNSNSSSVGSRY